MYSVQYTVYTCTVYIYNNACAMVSVKRCIHIDACKTMSAQPFKCFRNMTNPHPVILHRWPLCVIIKNKVWPIFSRQCHRLPICFLTSDLTNDNQKWQSETRTKELWLWDELACLIFSIKAINEERSVEWHSPYSPLGERKRFKIFFIFYPDHVHAASPTVIPSICVNQRDSNWWMLHLGT